MVRSASVTNPATRFDRFLFATVCADEHVGPVSVVSALARLDLDPWLEAAKLSAMSGAGATERMTMLLRSSPAGAGEDVQADAARLIGLLSGKRAAAIAAPAVKRSGLARRTHAWAIVLCVLLVGCLFGEQMLTINRQPAPPGGGIYATGASIAPPGAPTGVDSR